MDLFNLRSRASRKAGAQRRTSLWASAVLCASLGGGLATTACATASKADAALLTAEVLSGRADMVSGGSTLLGVTLPAGVPVDSLRFTVDGVPAKAQVLRSRDQRVEALVSGLPVGEHQVRVASTNLPDTVAQVVVRNHPLWGPIFSGPHLAPFECRTREAGLGAPLDANCSAATRYDWFYFTAGGERKRLAAPLGPRPADLASTTTLDGRSVPFIVRVESGTLNRAIYRIAVLDDPKAAGAWNPAGWNQRVVLRFGESTGVQYNQGVNSVDDVFKTTDFDRQSITALARGFAYVGATLNINKVNVNDPLAAETAMMLREHVAKHYGVPRWMAGLGGSGGAIQQLLIAQNYPGILDGLMADASFPDVFSTAMAVSDCRLLQRYFAHSPPTDEVRRAVEGHFKDTCRNWDAGNADAIVVTSGAVQPACGLSDPQRIYHPVRNPQGVRCSIYDVNAASLGRDADTGFVRRTLDNVGVQYGLTGLRSGAITVEQFLDLNEKIGGYDQDGEPATARTVSDLTALPRVYELGRVGTGSGGLSTVPIFHLRPYAEPAGDIHTAYNDIKLREQLKRANGRFDNQVIWTLPHPALGPLLGLDPAQQQALVELVRQQAVARLDLMTAWLDALSADPAPLTPDKVARLKPRDAEDACWSATDRVRHREPATLDGPGVCNTLYPKTPSPRMVAGASVADDILKCRLKRIDLADYAPAVFTPAQAARLAAVFPNGVCDWRQPGIGQSHATRTWVRY
ncbi:DUF6351 family protein [Eleftheria terrae]|uniref:DUF6351 family protein n=1 Tax=Eleftheria terrae TaxID=1597781 RepID=UPI00263B95BA|nr:DUF6351 family protein [Eleftheria terrae]WKB55860.1 DUF6351 family protein [Eleftheria terrae]